MTRDERTIGEAEAERRGYEAAKAQARQVVFKALRRPGGVPVADLEAWEDADEAIARMQPEDSANA